MNKHLKGKLICLFLILLPAIFLAGCSPSSPQTAAGDGGVWRSADGGKTFAQITDALATKGRIVKYNNADVRSIYFDPADARTIYVTTDNEGISYSYDGGDSWQKFNQLNKGRVRALAIDPKNHCTIYALAENKLYKTADCGRSWISPYYHQATNAYLSGLAVDPENPQTLYLGDSLGEVLKSHDGGSSWNTVYRVSNGVIMDILIDPANTTMVYAATLKNGIYKSIDAGLSWASLGEGLKAYAASSEYRQLIMDLGTPDSLILASKFGILRSTDGGQRWQVVNILSSPQAVNILAIAANPKNSKEIYYSTESGFIKTTDSGNSWSSQKLPTTRTGSALAVSPVNSNLIYLGTKMPAKK